MRVGADYGIALIINDSIILASSIKRKLNYMKIKFNLFLLGLIFLITGVTFSCTKSETLRNIPLFFYSHPLGIYNIYLNPTLSTIENHDSDRGYPYYKKKWYGKCPNHLGREKCFEFTVYPNNTNFSPNPMEKIKKYTHGESNRGEVRILTNKLETKYVYTINHEKKFCGPYALYV
ncbi:MAG: hypothetical protein A3E82_04575 [Gammaproteobacteria bacterium RIFCSPHIGHO2_12_FULL_38_11]|nr:MAG: hypothetical protein A3E82_04575 [Gammaproteobacteria bacterium RIFCSPHIGHO2_12_FULL_38_11]